MLNNRAAEKYRVKAMQFFDNKYDPHGVFEDVATGIVNMGNATSTRHAIAMVAIKKDADTATFKLYIDEEKFKDFTPEERAGVVWHELNHVLNEHLKEASEREKLGMPSMKILTMAQEIICNDTVLYHGVKLPLMNPDDKNVGIIYGEKFVGKNCFGMTTKEVYDLLVEQGEDENDQDDHNNQGASGQGEQGNQGQSGQGDQEQSDQGQSGQGDQGQSDQGQSGQEEQEDQDDGQGSSSHGHQGDEHGGCGGIYIDEDVTIEDIQNIIQDIIDGMSDPNNITSGDSDLDAKANTGQGMSQGSIREQLIKEGDVKLKWFELLKKIDPRVYNAMGGVLGRVDTIADWRFKPRSLAAISRNPNSPILPKMIPDGESSYGNNSTPVIIFAIDQSGSIGHDEARKARELATTIPSNSADVHVLAFATHCCKMDKTTGEFEYDIGGGTDFSSIVRKIRNLKNIDPREASVIVLTDGESYFYGDDFPEHPAKWYWFNIDNNYTTMSRFKNNIQQAFSQVQGCSPDENIFGINEITKW